MTDAARPVSRETRKRRPRAVSVVAARRAWATRKRLKAARAANGKAAGQ